MQRDKPERGPHMSKLGRQIRPDLEIKLLLAVNVLRLERRPLVQRLPHGGAFKLACAHVNLTPSTCVQRLKT